MEDLKLLAPLHHFIDHKERVFVLYLATSLLLALFLQWRAGRGSKKSLFSGVVSRDVYTHPSARVDYIYFIANAVLYAFIIAPFQFLGPSVSHQVFRFLESLSLPVKSVAVGDPSVVATVGVALVLALAADFSTFLAHLLAHRIPWLWEFHKVHHSAEVMTPITVYRMHPIDDIFTLCLGGIVVGVVDACMRFFIAPGVSPLLLFGLNGVIFIFYITGYNLRHSHVWFSYGPLLSKLFISPAQHQIHHSSARKHWDKNFGFIFAFWDLFFRSLYVPKEREELTFGLGEGRQEDIQYRSVTALYLLPFKKAYRRIVGRR